MPIQVLFKIKNFHNILWYHFPFWNVCAVCTAVISSIFILLCSLLHFETDHFTLLRVREREKENLCHDNIHLTYAVITNNHPDDCLSMQQTQLCITTRQFKAPAKWHPGLSSCRWNESLFMSCIIYSISLLSFCYFITALSPSMLHNAHFHWFPQWNPRSICTFICDVLQELRPATMLEIALGKIENYLNCHPILWKFTIVNIITVLWWWRSCCPIFVCKRHALVCVFVLVIRVDHVEIDRKFFLVNWTEKNLARPHALNCISISGTYTQKQTSNKLIAPLFSRAFSQFICCTSKKRARQELSIYVSEWVCVLERMCMIMQQRYD